MLSLIELIIALLVLLIPFVSTNLTYDSTLIKITAIKIGLILLLVIYALKSLGDRKFKIKKIPSLLLLFLLGTYLVFGSIAVPRPSSRACFATPVPAEEIFTAIIFFSFFLPSRIYPLALDLSGC